MAEIEEKTVTVPLDTNFQGEIARLTAEGWEVKSGTEPFATYTLVREKPDNLGMRLSLAIDESKVYLIRDGKIVT